jgi:hypothetical protein
MGNIAVISADVIAPMSLRVAGTGETLAGLPAADRADLPDLGSGLNEERPGGTTWPAPADPSAGAGTRRRQCNSAAASPTVAFRLPEIRWISARPRRLTGTDTLTDSRMGVWRAGNATATEPTACSLSSWLVA